MKKGWDEVGGGVGVLKKRLRVDAVRKYKEQAKFNQIRDSSLLNPLGQVLVPAFDVYSSRIAVK